MGLHPAVSTLACMSDPLHRRGSYETVGTRDLQVCMSPTVRATGAQIAARAVLRRARPDAAPFSTKAVRSSC